MGHVSQYSTVCVSLTQAGCWQPTLDHVAPSAVRLKSGMQSRLCSTGDLSREGRTFGLEQHRYPRSSFTRLLTLSCFLSTSAPDDDVVGCESRASESECRGPGYPTTLWSRSWWYSQRHISINISHAENHLKQLLFRVVLRLSAQIADP